MNDEINIMYISSVCSKEIYEELEKKVEKPLHYSIQKFHSLIIDGIMTSGKVKMRALCGIPVNNTNIKKRVFKNNKY